MATTPLDIITSIEETYKTLLDKLDAIEKKCLDEENYLTIRLHKSAKIKKKTLKDLFNLSDDDLKFFERKNIIHYDGWQQVSVEDVIKLKEELKNYNTK